MALSESGDPQLWVRSNGSGVTKKLEEAGWAIFPFWSADSKNIAYFSTNGKLRQIARDGGTPTVMATATIGRGGTWLPDGTILFAPDSRSPIFRLRHPGGNPEPVTKLEPWETTHRWPYALPDGKHFLFFATSHLTGASDEHPSGIYFASVDGKTHQFVVATNSQAILASGHLLYVRGRKLVAQRFDASSGKLTGDPIEISDEILVDPTVWRAVFDATEQGVLIFQRGAVKGGETVAWFDRMGKSTHSLYIPTGLSNGALSGNGEFLATESNPNNMLWVYETGRGTGRRLTTENGGERNPIWSADGKFLFYMTDIPPDMQEIRKRPADGTGSVEKIMQLKNFSLSSVSHDSRFVAGNSFGGGHISVTLIDVLQHKIMRKIEGPANHGLGVFSPDGRWIAYLSDQSGRGEVYVTSATQDSARVQVSVDGGNAVLWTKQGREICFTNEQGLSCADVTATDSNFSIRTPKLLFALPKQLDPGTLFFASSADGSRFLMPIIDPGASSPVDVIVNWQRLLKQ